MTLINKGYRLKFWTNSNDTWSCEVSNHGYVRIFRIDETELEAFLKGYGINSGNFGDCLVI